MGWREKTELRRMRIKSKKGGEKNERGKLVTPHFTVVYGGRHMFSGIGQSDSCGHVDKESRVRNLVVGNTAFMRKPKHTGESPFIMMEPTLVQVKGEIFMASGGSLPCVINQSKEM